MPEIKKEVPKEPKKESPVSETPKDSVEAEIQKNLVELKAKVYDFNMVKNQVEQQIAFFNNEISKLGNRLQELQTAKAVGKSPSPYVPPKA